MLTGWETTEVSGQLERKPTVCRQLLTDRPVSGNRLCYVLDSIVVLENVCLCWSPFDFENTGCTWLSIWPS